MSRFYKQSGDHKNFQFFNYLYNLNFEQDLFSKHDKCKLFTEQDSVYLESQGTFDDSRSK